MRKILFILTLLFIANVGCKKMSPDGGGLCACSVLQSPRLNLIVKSSAGADLLDANNPNAYPKEKLAVYRKDKDGNKIPVSFTIQPSFAYGNEKFSFNSIAADVSFLNATADSVMYLQTGPNKTYEITLRISRVTYSLENILVNNKPADEEKGELAKHGKFIYLTE